MKKRLIFSLFLIISILININSLAINQSHQDLKTNAETQFDDNNLEDWVQFLCEHNNLNNTDLNCLSKAAISSLYEQARIYRDWAIGKYNESEKNAILFELLNTPRISYAGPQNYPIKGIDLKSYTDEKFELDFLLWDTTANEWIHRTYAYLDYDKTDTILSQSEQFNDGTTVKDYKQGEIPSPEDLNPNTSFMGENYAQSLEDYTEWTLKERTYTAEKERPGIIDNEIFFHVKVLYHIDIFERDGWHSYYYYKNFPLSWFWTPNLDIYTLRIIDDDTIPPIISNIYFDKYPIKENYEDITINIIAQDTSGIDDLFIIDSEGMTYYDDNKDNNITIPNPGKLGKYEFTVGAIDNDTDRLGDQLQTTKKFTFEVEDDDLDPPIISNVIIKNAPIYENYEFIDIEVIVEDDSGISELFIEFLETKYIDSNQDSIISIKNPGKIGNYEFNITAIDADEDHEGDQLNASVISSFEVLDDDTEGPFISEVNFINSPIYDNEDYIDIEVLIDDASGISELYIEFMDTIYYDDDMDGFITILNPIIPGEYEIFITAVDADDDHEGDQLSTTIPYNFEVLDDDIEGPIISGMNIINSPIFDSYEFIEIEFFAEDVSGIGDYYIIFEGDVFTKEEVYSRIITNSYQINIPNPVIPGIYHFSLIVFDADNEYEGDESNTTELYYFEVFDDDVQAPNITSITIVNSPIYDSSNEIIIKIFVEDASGISELYIEFMDTIYYDDDMDGFITILNPIIPGEYEFTVFAIDSDIDYEGDWLISTNISSLQILDDDITAPQIIINENELGWDLLIIDDDGIVDSDATGEYIMIDQYGKIWGSGTIDQENIIYSILIPFKFGLYTLRVNSTNNDLEWTGDEEISEATSSITISLAYCYNYVIEQLEILKNYVDENLCSILAWSIRCKLWLAQEHLYKAYLYVENDSLTCGLIHDTIAQILIEIAEFETEFYHELSLISDEDAEYVVFSLHSIRNNIVLLKGCSVDYVLDLSYGYEIATIERDLLNFKDFIDQEILSCEKQNLINLILCAASKLELAIFQLSLEDQINETLSIAQEKLDLAIIEVNYLLCEEKISQELALYLILEINHFKTEIEEIKNTLQ